MLHDARSQHSVCMMTTKAGKSDGEATFAGARGND